MLLGAFAERAEEANWEPADLELQPSHNTDETLQDALGGLLERAQARLSRFERLRAAAGRALRAGRLSVTWEDISLTIAPGSARENDLAKDIFATVELAVTKGREGLVLLLDEAQLIRDERGQRLFRGEEVDSLPKDEALAAFTRPLEQTGRVADDEVAEAVVEEVEGYPYFIQLWGSELWDAADLAGTDRLTAQLLDEARPEIYQRLDRDFLQRRAARPA